MLVKLPAACNKTSADRDELERLSTAVYAQVRIDPPPITVFHVVLFLPVL